MSNALGVDVAEPPDDWTPVEAVVIAKCLLPEGDESGPYGIIIRSSDGLSPWDIAGMLRSAVLTNDHDLMSGAD